MTIGKMAGKRSIGISSVSIAITFSSECDMELSHQGAKKRSVRSVMTDPTDLVGAIESNHQLPPDEP